MFKRLSIVFLLLSNTYLFSQVKVSGHVVDDQNEPVPFANVIFKGSTKGTISDENGHFYLESRNTFKELEISFIGFETKIVPLQKKKLQLKYCFAGV